jgi:YidC/Oxa1 family membrane protein insertase
MFYQMRLTPQPTMDSSQSPQMMMKVMPFMITAICYNFSCALAVYSTTNGLFTIVQQKLVNKYAKVDDPAATKSPGGRPVKNVTPTKKRLKD